MFQKERCQPRDTSTLLFNGNKISTRLANLKLLVATIFSLLALSKKALASSHPLHSTEYDVCGFRSCHWCTDSKWQGASNKALKLKVFVEHPPLFLFSNSSSLTFRFIGALIIGSSRRRNPFFAPDSGALVFILIVWQSFPLMRTVLKFEQTGNCIFNTMLFPRGTQLTFESTEWHKRKCALVMQLWIQKSCSQRIRNILNYAKSFCAVSLNWKLCSENFGLPTLRQSDTSVLYLSK